AATVLPSTLINRAHVGSPTKDHTPTNNTATDPTNVVTTADLALAKAVTTSVTHPFTPGTDGTYLLTVTNHGPSDAAAPMKIVDTLPPGESFSSGTGTNWSCSAAGSTVTCTKSTALAATAASTLKLVVHVTPGYTGSTLVNTATVSSPTNDPTPTNNTSSVTVTNVTPLAHLTVKKTHTGTFTAGDTATYTVTVKNTGPSDNVGGFKVTDTLPPGETYVSAPGTGWTCTAATGGFVCAQTAGLA